MSDKVIIGVDVDGVLRDFCNTLVNVIKTYHPEYLKDEYDETTEPSIDGGIITDWHLENNFNCTKEDLQGVYWGTHADEIMGNGSPIVGSEKQMKELLEFANEHENEVEFWAVTSQKKHAFHLTLKWLGNMGYNFKRVIFERGRSKWKTEVDYLVDDSPSNWEAWKEGRGDDDKFILVDAPYNQEIEPKHRITELLELYHEIPELYWKKWTQ
jgi:5'(3')-deoxyribonucleotidase